MWQLVIILMTSCTTREPFRGDRTFSREDFRETKFLTDPEEIVIDSLLNPASFRVLRDSLLLVGNQPNCDYLFEVYSLNTLQPLLQLVTKGNGPGEMFTCGLGLHDNLSADFYLQDDNSKTCYWVHLDTLLHTKKWSVKTKLNYSSEVLATSGICLLNDKEHYLGYHMWYLDDKKFSHVSSPIAYYRNGEDDSKDVTEYPFFVAPVNGASFFCVPDRKQIWLADMHRDLISIYNDSLQSICTLEGPDHFLPQYTEKPINAPIRFVTFTDDYDYRAYTDYFLTKHSIYLVYEGTKHFNPQALSPVEIFKLDYDGNLICNYKLDRYVYSISVNDAEDLLYCASRSTVMEPPVILKYKL